MAVLKELFDGESSDVSRLLLRNALKVAMLLLAVIGHVNNLNL